MKLVFELSYDFYKTSTRTSLTLSNNKFCFEALTSLWFNPMHQLNDKICWQWQPEIVRCSPLAWMVVLSRRDMPSGRQIKINNYKPRGLVLWLIYRTRWLARLLVPLNILFIHCSSSAQNKGTMRCVPASFCIPTCKCFTQLCDLPAGHMWGSLSQTLQTMSLPFIWSASFLGKTLGPCSSDGSWRETQSTLGLIATKSALATLSPSYSLLLADEAD